MFSRRDLLAMFPVTATERKFKSPTRLKLADCSATPKEMTRITI